MYRLQSRNRNKDIHDTYRDITLRYIHERTEGFHSLVSPKYRLIKDLVHHILSGCDVFYGLRCHDKFFEQVLMLLRAVAHWETSLHGVELVPSLDLCRGQRHRRTMTNDVEGDLPNMDQDILETSGDRGTPCIDGVHGHVRRQLERLQLRC